MAAGGAGTALAVLVCSVTPATSCWSFPSALWCALNVVLGGSGPEGGWPYAETPVYLMAKPEMSCAPVHMLLAANSTFLPLRDILKRKHVTEEFLCHAREEATQVEI